MSAPTRRNVPSHQLSAPLPPLATTTKLTVESEADTRLRDRDGSPPRAFGGKRRNSSLRAGTIGGLKRREWWILGVITALGVLVRFWNISWPDSVVFDEVHFGGFAAKYIRQRFFMDVHPPLAKMLITLAAFIGGFDGNFDFKDIGKDYTANNVPYVIMRSFPAILGLALIPISFLTLIAMRLSLATAILGALLITFENAMIAQSRLILLDSFLLFFTGLTMYFWVKFANLDSDGAAFTNKWWINLTLTGLGLGAVVSCKWVGLFTIAAVGMGTLRQLWLLLGNLKVTPKMWIKHFAARALCLIVVPAVFYMFMFQIHFWILTQSGDGDGFMSSEFQHTLSGHGMDDTYADVGFGSVVSIRHVATQGGYLHSHAHAYPTGSKQQQITLYPHKDDNNNWRIVNGSEPDAPPSYPWDTLPFEEILQGTKIRLEHVSSQKRLHSHDIRPPVSEVDFQNEVSGYGFEGFAGDANDDFIVEITPKTRGRRDKQARHRLKTLRSEFRLRHALSGCYLFSHKVKLPEWGFEQQEVTCNKNPTWDNSLWYIETATHAQLGVDAPKVNYERPSFFAKFWELQGVMWRTNAGLTERHAYDSRPPSWPVLRRGINFWVKDHRQVYLIGNPVVWWSSTLAVGLYIAIRALLVLREKRGFRDLYQPKVSYYDEVCGFLVISWALHYLPFFLMQRQLFLHHYLPALYFAILCFCAVFDFVTSWLRPRVRIQIAAVILVLAVWNWNYLSPLTYASPWTRGQCEKAKWLKSWDFSCSDFYESTSRYHSSAVKAVISPKVEETEAGQVTTTMVEEAPEPIKNAFEDADAPPEEKTMEIGPINDIPMLDTTALPPKPHEPEASPEPLEDTRAPIGKDAGAPQVTAEEEIVGWHGDAEDDGKIAEGVQVTKEEAPVGAKVEEVVDIQMDSEQQRLADEALKADAAAEKLE